jgi:hypothetical protein
MTDPHRPDPSDRDPALDAAWKAHSTELPPPRLDAAILAAARREVHTRPHAVGDDDGVAQARGPSRAWWGLAAAATIGAIAFGVLQLAPPPTTDQSATVATDIPRTPPERGSPAETPRDAPPPLAELQRSPGVSAIPRADAPTARREDDRRSALTRAPEPVPSAAPRPNAAKPAEQEKRRADTREGQRQKAGESSVASNASAFAEAPAAAAPPPASPDGAVATPKPFPGATPAPSTAAAPALPSASATTPPDALAKSEAAGNVVDARRRESGERMAAVVPMQPPAQAARRAQADTAAQGAAAESVAKLQAARTPAAWIERIRTLHAEQRLDDAARELNAFRDAYPDADKQLPPALSAWAASIKRN